jgi:hypothetical protein
MSRVGSTWRSRPGSALSAGQPLVTGVGDPGSQNVEGVGGLEQSFDRRGVSGTKPADDDVRMGRELVEEQTGLGPLNLHFGDGQGGQKIGQATDAGST